MEVRRSNFWHFTLCPRRILDREKLAPHDDDEEDGDDSGGGGSKGRKTRKNGTCARYKESADRPCQKREPRILLRSVVIAITIVVVIVQEKGSVFMGVRVCNMSYTLYVF